MPIEVTIKADTLAEFNEVTSRLAQAGKLGTARIPEVVEHPSVDAWNSFLRVRSDQQRAIVQAIVDAGGRITLRRLTVVVNLTGQKLSGTVGSLQKVAKTTFGAPLIDARPWFRNQQGDWDREYVLNKGIMPIN